MKQWRLYSCEEGHSWQFLLDDSVPEQEADIVCAYGHTAVMAKRAKPSDYVVVSVIPKARQIDSVTAKIGYKTEFYVQIESLLDGWKCMTNKSYSKEEAVQLAQLFVGLERHAAGRVWQSKKLGGEGLRMDLN